MVGTVGSLTFFICCPDLFVISFKVYKYRSSLFVRFKGIMLFICEFRTVIGLFCDLLGDVKGFQINTSAASVAFGAEYDIIQISQLKTCL
ncbi:hypothetical protein [Ruminococcus flavefaciens]|uniref:hypothetical protein n=1 Tax=Ruminococcus flavefaciens TaxID=1265 RepID=UPI000465C8E2|nr:hypothetical protein [Ruminococcus flavefaciens]